MTDVIFFMAAMLFRGFWSLDGRLKMSSSVIPVVGVMASVGNTMALINIGNGSAVDVRWELVDSGESGLISHLLPQKSWQIDNLEQQHGIMLCVTYKSLSGKTYSRTFDAAQIAVGASGTVFA